MAEPDQPPPPPPGQVRRWTSRKLWFALVSMGCAMAAAHARWVDGQQLVYWVTYTVAAYMVGNTGSGAVTALQSLAQALWARKDPPP